MFTFLNTLNTLFKLNIFKTCKVSVVFPIPILSEPPIETVFGILLTNISSTVPIPTPVDIAFPRVIVSVLIPTLNVFVKFDIEVFNPDITTES